MQRSVLHTFTTFGLLLILVCSPASGQTTSSSPAAAHAWTFDVVPYLWLPALDGDITVRGRTAPVDISSGDFIDTIFNSFQFAAIGRVEARRGPLVFTLDLLYLGLEEEDTTRLGIETEVDFSQLIVEFGGGYRLGEWPLGMQPGPKLSVEALGGGRYVNLDAGLEITGTGPLGIREEVDRTVDWLEPFVGARLRLALSETLAFVVRGDVGGFSVGSDVTWNLVGTLQYQVSRQVTLAGGYRVLDIDYDQGSETNRFVYDVQTRGPILAVAMHF
jgi:opacity protein-like surface antigen